MLTDIALWDAQTLMGFFPNMPKGPASRLLLAAREAIDSPVHKAHACLLFKLTVNRSCTCASYQLQKCRQVGVEPWQQQAEAEALEELSTSVAVSDTLLVYRVMRLLCCCASQ